ncbi:MAG: DUF1830 domain-containing protein [Vulcanococcus sp.]
MAQLSCGYRNSSDRMVIVRCIGPEEFFLERVVFPFELLSFLAPPEAIVQIWTHGLGGPELLESLEAAELLVESSAEEPHLSLAKPPGGNLVDLDWQEAV